MNEASFSGGSVNLDQRIYSPYGTLSNAGIAGDHNA